MKNVWVDDNENVWLPSTAVDVISPNEVWVTCETGRKRMSDANLRGLRPVHNDEGKDSLSLLRDPWEGPVLHLLRTRFLQDKIYTCCGPRHLISINPNKFMDGLYDNPDDHLDCIPGVPALNKSVPHIFSTTNEALRGIYHRRVDQAVVLHGRNGSGKTEAAKLIYEFLLHANGVAHSKTARTKAIASTFPESNVVFEAFGNAKTADNDNSSRFGRLTRFCYSESLQLSSVYTDVFLLDRFRLTRCRSGGDRNFHVFYQMVRGLMASDEEQAEALGLVAVESFAILSAGRSTVVTSEEDDIGEFEVLQLGLQAMGLSKAEISGLWEILACILHLGNVRWHYAESPPVCSTMYLEEISHLLGIAEIALIGLFCSHPSNGGSVPPEVSNNRVDSLIRILYAHCFEWIVKKMNFALSVSSSSGAGVKLPEMSSDVDICGFYVVDLFGFECEATSNDFAQLCVNYSDERLLQFFRDRFFGEGLHSALEDGVQFANVDLSESVNSLLLLDVLESPSYGLLPEIESGTSTRDKLISKLKGSAREREAVVHSVSSDQFVVRHFTGEVCYSLKTLLTDATEQSGRSAESVAVNKLLLTSKNALLLNMVSTNVSPDILQIANVRRTSSLGSIPQFPVPIPASHVSVNSSNGKNVSMGGTTSYEFGSIRRFLDRTFGILSKAQCSFVSCLAPNYENLSDSFDSRFVVGQLRGSGVLTSLNWKTAGWRLEKPFRMLQKEFLQYHHKLLSSSDEAYLRQDDNELLDRLTEAFLRRALPRGGYSQGRQFVYLSEDSFATIRWKTCVLNRFIRRLRAFLQHHVHEEAKFPTSHDVNGRRGSQDSSNSEGSLGDLEISAMADRRSPPSPPPPPPPLPLPTLAKSDMEEKTAAASQRKPVGVHSKNGQAPQNGKAMTSTAESSKGPIKLRYGSSEKVANAPSPLTRPMNISSSPGTSSVDAKGSEVKRETLGKKPDTQNLTRRPAASKPSAGASRGSIDISSLQSKVSGILRSDSAEHNSLEALGTLGTLESARRNRMQRLASEDFTDANVVVKQKVTKTTPQKSNQKDFHKVKTVDQPLPPSDLEPPISSLSASLSEAAAARAAFGAKKTGGDSFSFDSVDTSSSFYYKDEATFSDHIRKKPVRHYTPREAPQKGRFAAPRKLKKEAPVPHYPPVDSRTATILNRTISSINIYPIISLIRSRLLLLRLHRFHDACMCGDLETVRKTLVAHPELVHVLDWKNDFVSASQAAISGNQPEVLKILRPSLVEIIAVPCLKMVMANKERIEDVDDYFSVEGKDRRRSCSLLQYCVETKAELSTLMTLFDLIATRPCSVGRSGPKNSQEALAQNRPWKVGWLAKRNARNRWQQRWIILTDTGITYKLTESEASTCDFFPMSKRCASVSRGTFEEKWVITVTLVERVSSVKKRSTLSLRASSELEFIDWWNLLMLVANMDNFRAETPLRCVNEQVRRTVARHRDDKDNSLLHLLASPCSIRNAFSNSVDGRSENEVNLVACAAWLISIGCDVQEVNRLNQTAQQVAEEHCRWQLASLLELNSESPATPKHGLSQRLKTSAGINMLSGYSYLGLHFRKLSFQQPPSSSGAGSKNFLGLLKGGSSAKKLFANTPSPLESLENPVLSVSMFDWKGNLYEPVQQISSPVFKSSEVVWWGKSWFLGIPIEAIFPPTNFQDRTIPHDAMAIEKSNSMKPDPVVTLVISIRDNTKAASQATDVCWGYYQIDKNNLDSDDVTMRFFKGAVDLRSIPLGRTDYNGCFLEMTMQVLRKMDNTSTLLSTYFSTDGAVDSLSCSSDDNLLRSFSSDTTVNDNLLKSSQSGSLSSRLFSIPSFHSFNSRKDPVESSVLVPTVAESDQPPPSPALPTSGLPQIRTVEFIEGVHRPIRFFMRVPHTATPGMLIFNLAGHPNRSLQLPPGVKPGDVIVVLAPADD